MRIAVLIAASVLVAGCSDAVDGQAQRPEPTLSAPSGTTRPSPSPSPTTTPPAGPPAGQAPVAEVIRWVEAGAPAAADGFHTVSRDGISTDLGEEIAFTTPSGTSRCMTDRRAEGALTCLVELTDPPPRPADVYGEWKGGWVDYPGASLDVGSAHGDPGPFSDGFGAELPYGHTLAFGDYRCRTDPAGLFCVNYAHQSAARFSDAGVVTFGCLEQQPPAPGIGLRFSC
ncbi:hypothetical protein E4P42_08635 [Mycobacterium sp. PS03-16]|uniref:hypothetical protein n=1 Tax=Mycobacterium sp. PS03-16 TaxID=2559611 RepID=UPI00107383AA|nr:hypothetical protein [Mycobacterium sp. PS03-16]TFV59462.1 hypothetical protein E4P42_08635 [Mycobacterium sp. PS03-16]